MCPHPPHTHKHTHIVSDDTLAGLYFVGLQLHILHLGVPVELLCRNNLRKVTIIFMFIQYQHNYSLDVVTDLSFIFKIILGFTLIKTDLV